MAIQLVLQILLVLVFMQQASAQTSSVAKPGCQEKCGNVTIPYPFGIGYECSFEERFKIECNKSTDPPKPILNICNLEVLSISVQKGMIQVNNPVYKDCTKNGSKTQGIIILFRPLRFSETQNRFTGMGCDNLALMTQDSLNAGGCVSSCGVTTGDNNCLGINCCQTKLSPSLSVFFASLQVFNNPTPQDGNETCRYGFIVNQTWFENLEDIYSVQKMEQVPAVLEWRLTPSCQSFEGIPGISKNESFCRTNANCTQGLCSCLPGYEGNPYLSNGCQDIDECAHPSIQGCYHICTNTQGGYYCSCRNGYEATGNYCTKRTSTPKKVLFVLAIAICSGLGVLLVLVATWWLHKKMKQRKLRNIKEKNFERNGGLLLHQQVSSSEGNVDTTKLFTSKELETATDHYNKDRILGQGGQGTVYKGMLTDGRIVAVKKSKIEDESKQEQFINEVVLLSKINHRNIVKLHGCCLETDVPLLVYEFIPNGTLYEYIHDNSEDFPLTWDIRVRVAIEIAGSLFYLHSAASVPIYHRDIKSSNILLDEKYRAKLADFGTSKSIAIDQTHLTTRVQGTFGYLDPEYFQSSQYTDKSDVYSFGVVLVELLTGLKAILAPRAHDEERSLVTHFILTMKEKRLFDILDPRIAKEGRKEEIVTFANIAYRCLNLNGRKRPTMKQVAVELESINFSHKLPTPEQNYVEIDYPVNQLNGLWDLTSTSLSSSTSNSVKVDVEPLIRKS